MSSAFLGVGWSFPVQLDQTNQIALAEYEESVSQSIWIILSTAPGERLMRPDFGCGIYNQVFAVNNATTAGLIAQEVRQALVNWEPRIDLLDVQVTPGDDAVTLLISINYQVRATNNVFNLVYPFYLERGTP